MDTFLKNPNWSFPIDKQSIKFTQQTFNEPYNHQKVESILARQVQPLDELTLTLNFQGVYSLPDQWKAKIVRNVVTVNSLG